MSDRDAIIAKIKKCLALSKSSNENEAAIALRQAQRLMEQHGVTDFDIETADIEEEIAVAGASAKPTTWESALAARVAHAFGTAVIFRGVIGVWVFVAPAPAAEIARYAFEVMLRQVRRARREYIKDRLKRCATASKTRRADLFCEGWVITASALISTFAGNEAGKQRALAYAGKKYKLESLAPRNRSAGRKLANYDYGDLVSGRHAGRSAQLNRGVGGADAPLALE